MGDQPALPPVNTSPEGLNTTMPPVGAVATPDASPMGAASSGVANSVTPVGVSGTVPPIVGEATKPEVVTVSAGGMGGNKPWVALGAVVVLVVLGVLGAFVYFSFFGPKEEPVVAPSPVVQVASPSATVAPSPSLEDSLQSVETGVMGLESGITTIDSSLNDKMGNLSE